MNVSQIEKELMEVSEGLLMLSETDAPFEFYYHQKPEDKFDEDIVVEWDGKPGGTAVQVLTLGDFFNRMKNPHKDADETQKKNAERFKKLEAKLNELLEDVKVYKLSEITLPVYIIGRTKSGDYAGLKTLVVET
jgi:hypothetical protein